MISFLVKIGRLGSPKSSASIHSICVTFSEYGCGGGGSKEDAIAEQETRAGIETIVREQYAQLGGLRFAEGANLVVFVVLVLLWFFRRPGFMPGYAEFFEKGQVMRLYIYYAKI